MVVVMGAGQYAEPPTRYYTTPEVTDMGGRVVDRGGERVYYNTVNVSHPTLPETTPTSTMSNVINEALKKVDTQLQQSYQNVKTDVSQSPMVQAITERVQALNAVLSPFTTYQKQEQERLLRGEGWKTPVDVMVEKENYPTKGLKGTIEKVSPNIPVPEMIERLKAITPPAQEYVQELQLAQGSIQRQLDIKATDATFKVITELQPKYQELVNQATSQESIDKINEQFRTEVINKFNKEYGINLQQEADKKLKQAGLEFQKIYEEKLTSELTGPRILDVIYQAGPSYVAGTLIGPSVAAFTLAQPAATKAIGIAGIATTAAGFGILKAPQIVKEFKYSTGAGLRELGLSAVETAVPIVVGGYGAKVSAEEFLKTGKIIGEKAFLVSSEKPEAIGKSPIGEDIFMKKFEIADVQKLQYQTPELLRLLNIKPFTRSTFNVERTAYIPVATELFTRTGKTGTLDFVSRGQSFRLPEWAVALKTGEPVIPPEKPLIFVRNPLTGKWVAQPASSEIMVGKSLIAPEGYGVGYKMGPLNKEITSPFAYTMPTKNEGEFIQQGIYAYGLSSGKQVQGYPYTYIYKNLPPPEKLTIYTSDFTGNKIPLDTISTVKVTPPSIPKGQWGNQPSKALIDTMYPTKPTISQTSPTYVGGEGQGISLYVGKGTYEKGLDIISATSPISGVFQSITWPSNPQAIIPILKPLSVTKIKPTTLTTPDITTKIITDTLVKTTPDITTKVIPDVISDTITKTVTRTTPDVIAKVTPDVISRTITKVTPTTLSNIVPTIVPPVNTPSTAGFIFGAKGKERKKVKAYQAYVKRRGKFLPVGIPTTESQAIQLGERITRQTLAATFMVKPTKKEIYGVETGYRPNPNVFRTYAIRGATRIPLPELTFIEKAGTRKEGFTPKPARLTPSAVREIQIYKLRRTNVKNNFLF